MRQLRLVVWLMALMAFAWPVGLLHTTKAEVSTNQTAMSDCPYHAPPPQPCPDKGGAKHAAGTCCPLMAAMVALMPSAPEYSERQIRYDYAPSVATGQPGLLFTKDPPPPRV
jgi:hypothetical protein